MPFVIVLITLALIFPAMGGGTAQAAEERARKAKPYKSQDVRRRPSTEAADGTCHRDTGRPFHSLSLNSRCDREEFWQRFNDTGGNDRR